MSDQAQLERKLADLEAELALARAAARLNTAADEALEQAMRDRLSLGRAMDLLLPLLCEHTGAQAAFAHTFDENLELHDFCWSVEPAADGGFGVETAPIVEATGRRQRYLARGDAGDREITVLGLPLDGPATVLGQALDVAGQHFGCAALRFDEKLAEERVSTVQHLLGVWCEEIDNYLAAIARARAKHHITRALSEALKHPVLDRGIDAAIEELRRHVAFEDMILVYRHEDEPSGEAINYKVIKDGELCHDSRRHHDREVDEFIRDHALRMIMGGDNEVPHHFGLTRYREEVLINGVKTQQLVGRLVVASDKGEFNTFDRDLLERFADYLRQRIVDFNKEWKRLALCFPQPTVVRLLAEENYTREFLAPRERDVAVMFCDISGFTRVSEQVLQKPELIGKLIDTWGEHAVDIIWDTGGVFDKMVGDCVIGLWGPPLFDDTPDSRCSRALDAALRIRELTRKLGAEHGLPELEGLDPPMGVATGLNFCPLFVGLFGPNEDYTGFSSGMNNTARLQGLATRDEILCMDRLVATLGEGAEERFGPARQANVKNVAEPLVFHEVV